MSRILTSMDEVEEPEVVVGLQELQQDSFYPVRTLDEAAAGGCSSE